MGLRFSSYLKVRHSNVDDREKPYRFRDHRRVGSRGERLNQSPPPGLRVIHFRDIDKALKAAFDYSRAQVERLDNRKASWPRTGKVRDLLRGFIVSTQQLFAGTVGLMADNRPKQLVLPAGIVARALVEGLGNLLALLEDPDLAPDLFLRDDYRTARQKLAYHHRRFGNRPGYAHEEEKLQQYGTALGLSTNEMADPAGLLKWPTPGRLLERTQSPRLKGERRSVFEEVYGFWYGSLSAYSHHRLSALQLAIYTEEQPDETTFAMAKSTTASLAVLVALCVLSEVEAFCGLVPSQRLRDAWSLVRDVDDVVQAVYRLRYGRLLGVEAGSPG